MSGPKNKQIKIRRYVYMHVCGSCVKGEDAVDAKQFRGVRDKNTNLAGKGYLTPGVSCACRDQGPATMEVVKYGA